MRLGGLWILALAMLLADGVPARAEIVTDPGFESCVNPEDAPPGWSGGAPGTIYCNSDSHTGSWGAQFVFGTLSQSISTTAGDNYDFSFWLNDRAASPDSFTASFGSNEVLDLVNPSNFGYTLEDFTVTATAATTTISFTGDVSGGVWNLDDVSVTDLGPTAPEPTSLALFGTGLLGLWLLSRRTLAKTQTKPLPKVQI
jgi:hypothetical protein